MTVQPSADRLEYEAEQRAKRQQSDGTYYGSTTTGATPQTPVAQPQPQYYGGTPTSPSGYAPAPPVYYGGTPTAPYSPAQPTGYRAFPDVVIPPNINVPDYDYSSAAAYQAAWDASRAPAVYAYYLQRFGGNTEQATIASMAVDEGFNIAPRELSAMQRFRRRETERTLAEQAPKSLQDFPSLSLSAREQSALNRFRTKYAVEMMMGRGGEFLERHPTFLNAIAGAVEAQQFTPEDARRLVNLGQLDSAFNAYLDAVNDPRAQRDILMSMDSIQRAAAMDYFMEKFRELQEFSEQDPGWA